MSTPEECSLCGSSNQTNRLEILIGGTAFLRITLCITHIGEYLFKLGGVHAELVMQREAIAKSPERAR